MTRDKLEEMADTFCSEQALKEYAPSIVFLLERVADDAVNENWEFVVLELQKKAAEIAERAQAEQREADALIVENYQLGVTRHAIAQAIREAK